MEQVLHQILHELHSLKREVQKLNQNQLLLDKNQQQMAIQIYSIYQSIVRLEDGQPKDIFAFLERIHNNFVDKDAEIAALNKRVFRLKI
ncbi:hypothetical protein [Paenibacillus apiarius]|uniref:hypothetical protein n=1 Tax=Paenibacillus apiarius TaxID=46240 RepID=UPI003B3AA889